MILGKHYYRIIFVFIFFCILYIILLANLYKLQIKNHEMYKQLAQQQYTVAIHQMPGRAPIFDRNGIYLALNKDAPAAFIMPYRLVQTDKLAVFLQEHFPDAYTRWQSKKDAKFLYVARKLNDQEIECIHNAHLKDIHIINEPSRYYPHVACATIVGMTDIDNKGIAGIEQSCDQLLKGSPTHYQLERDARSGNFHFNKINMELGNQGSPMQLTLDSTLQFLVHKELQRTAKKLGCQEGGVVIINPENGDILAMASVPSCDPNECHSIDHQLIKNTTIANAYEYGSVNKVFVALAALQEHITTIDELIDCKNAKTTYIDGRKVNTWKAAGELPFKDVIAKSNNIGIAIVAKRLQEKLYDHYLNLGFGHKTHVGLPAEQKGFVNHPANWSKQSIISLSYGYEIRSTLLQIARAFCMIARNGRSIKPRINCADQIVIGPQVYDDTTIAHIKEILEETTLHGTAHLAHITGYRILSKTGSAHVSHNGTYDENNNVYSCAGIVEKNNYQRIIAVYVRKDGGHQQHLFASTMAVPLFEQVTQRLLMHDHVLN